MRAPGVVLGAGIALCAFVAAAPAQTTSRPAAPRKAVAAPGAEFESLRTRAEAAEAAGRLPEAVSLYAQAVRLQPTWTEGFWRLGTTAYDADQFRECRDAFAQVVKREPQHGAAWAFRGLCEFGLQAYSAVSRAPDQGQRDWHRQRSRVPGGRGRITARSCWPGSGSSSGRSRCTRASSAAATPVRRSSGALGITMLRLPHPPVGGDARSAGELVALAGRAGVLRSAW